ncbi:glycosyltransferase family 39 protein [Oscillatoria sp. CS-180]|uniref:ArnT family glycosyltransferase n=1 Tax=Oscillatoria sp. CS-180 TaxID=3021720 RepID=UPI00232E8F3B|nr:glycosyltransferase family 39 protein [Oscillatoria sp. CS-180]MDB9527709.1 glycosyltransferase family 39 protein [Oscillatoria sp. CS-180]
MSPVVGWWLGGGLAFRIIVAGLLPIGFDEAYYYLYSRHLAWSYFDHPIMVALTTGLGWWPTGIITPLTIRLGALGLHTLSLLLLYLVARHLFNEKTGVLTIAIASIAPILWIAFGVLTSPDNGLIFFWTLTLLIAAWEFIPYQMSNSTALRPSAYKPSYRIALIGLTLGLTCLSKYHGFVLGAGLVGFCLASDRARKALRSPWIALSLLIFLLTLTPLWLWNSQNEWFSFRFHLFMRFEGDGDPNPYRVLDAFGTWLLGILYLSPTIGFPLWWSTGRSLVQSLHDRFTHPLSEGEKAARDRTALILWTSLPLALGFTLLGGKQAIYPAWPAPGFWGLTLLLAHSAVNWRSRTLRRWLGGTAAFLGTLVLIALLHLSLGVLQKPGHFSPLGGLVPVEQDGSTTLLDVLQMRSRFSQTPKLTQALENADFVFTDEFYLSGYVDMALYPLASKSITCFSQDPRGFAFWHDPQRWLGQDALYITLDSLHRDRNALTAEFQPYFQTLELVEELQLTRGGAITETVLIYRALNMQQAYSYPYP